MSTNSILTGILGLAAGAAVTYFVVSPTNTDASTPPSTNSTSQITSLSAPPPCLATSKTITFDEANDYINAYLSGTDVLKNGGANLKGWYMERCVIEQLLADLPFCDGIQLYIGQMTSGDNNLIWVASKDTVINGVNLRENIVSTNSIYDFSSGCPAICPAKNDLPK
jgi:hypothetical protein